MSNAKKVNGAEIKNVLFFPVIPMANAHMMI
jgi:hypothetical protein